MVNLLTKVFQTYFWPFEHVDSYIRFIQNIQTVQ